MSGELARKDFYRAARGEPVSQRMDRRTMQAAREIFNETGLARLELDAIANVAECALNRSLDLDTLRRSLAQDDPALNMMLSEIQATAMRQIRAVQGSFLTGP